MKLQTFFFTTGFPIMGGGGGGGGGGAGGGAWEDAPPHLKILFEKPPPKPMP